jgi:hypothetical protein
MAKKYLLALLPLLLPSLALAGKTNTARPAARLNALVAVPAQVTLNGRYAEARVLLEERTADGKTRDGSSKARFTVADPALATIDESGIVRPLKDGKTTLLAQYQERTIRIPLTISNAGAQVTPRFHADVEPILSRTGCNGGACHGAAQGKGGFKLSLQGYDPEMDYAWITRANLARRITPSQPDNSLFLRKPTLGVVHKGGKRFDVKSSEYRLLKDWIVGGMPAPDPKEPKMTRLEVYPQARTLPLKQTQRFIVTAHFEDGTKRDVTAQTVFTASDENVATVTPDGEATIKGSGEGAILMRYQGLVKTARLISPFAAPRKAEEAKQEARGNAIDRLVLEKLFALGLNTSTICTDSDFLRRAYLDTIGLLPTAEEARAFLADTHPEKRTRLITALLERPEYVDFWALKWGDILKSSRRILSDKGMYAMNRWIRQSVQENKPWNQFAQELILAQGSTFDNGPANYYRAATNPNELSEMTSQVFLGVRMQCAKCHNHPYERWTQNQYYQMAAFFARVGRKGGARGEESQIFVNRYGDVTHPKTRKTVLATALDASPLPADFQGDRRQALADWITSDRNPFFAKVLVNRLWRHFMGRGFVEPVDDMRVTNPASNEALLDYLSKDFVQHGYDVKYLMKSILLTQTYQRSAIPTKKNAQDTKYYSHYTFKRMGAEQLLEAISSATGVAEKFAGYPAGVKATQLPDTTVASYFLELFGRPARNIACECERSDEPNLGQMLHLMNNSGINGKIADKQGRIAKAFAQKQPLDQMLEEVYLSALSRYPSQEEKKQALALITKSKAPQTTAEDLLWVLINSKEFVFNH